MSVPVAHVFLSPHLDDAAWSCGGLIAKLRASRADVTVHTLCAGVPEAGASLPSFFGSVATGPGDAAELQHRRRAEDERAMGLLSVHHVWHDALDAVFRCPSQYASPRGLTGPVAADDPLPARAEATIAAISSEALLYAPLGIGDHVDHRIVHDSARRASRAVVYYEDVPYALDPAAVDRRLRALGGALESLEVDVEGELATWVAVIAAYESQIGGAQSSVEPLLARHLARGGTGTCRMRLWGEPPALARLAAVLDGLVGSRPAVETGRMPKLSYVGEGWDLNEKFTPCDLHLVELLTARELTNATIFHLGTGNHHTVGKWAADGGRGNLVLGITLSPPEVQSYMDLAIEREDVARAYKVFFGDAYQLEARALPELDVATLFHLGEMRPMLADAGRLTDLELAQLLTDKLRVGGQLIFYRRSFAYSRMEPVIAELRATRALGEPEQFKSLVVFRKEAP